MVLRGLEREDVAAIAEDDEADLFAAETLFDNQRRFQRGQGLLGHGAVLGHDDAFTGGEAIGFEHHGKAEAVEHGAGLGSGFGHDEGGSRDVTLL
jgi:hypothetical protein